MKKEKAVRAELLIFFNWYGGKIRFVEELRKYVPKFYKVLIEPYGGSFAFGLNSNAEELIYTDINPLIFNLFNVMRDLNTRDGFINRILRIKFSEKLFDEALMYYDYDFEGMTSVDKAVYTYILIKSSFNGCMQNYSKGAEKKNKDKFKLKRNLLAVAEKIYNTEVFDICAIDLIKDMKERYQGREGEVLCLIDCPYLESTRGATSVYGKNGEYEMTRYEHIELLEEIIDLHKKGYSFILCGKDNDYECLYDYMLEPYGIEKKLLKALKNNAQYCEKGETKDDYEEYIWTNIPQTL